MSDMSRNIEGKEAEEILDSILADYELDRTIDKMEDFYDQPNKEVIIDIIEKLLKIIYRVLQRSCIQKLSCKPSFINFDRGCIVSSQQTDCKSFKILSEVGWKMPGTD